MNKSSFGIIGLGVMGKSLALNMLDYNIPLSVYNRISEGEEDIIPNFLHESNHSSHVLAFTDLPDFITSIERPRKILLMVKAGKVVDLVTSQLESYLEPGDIIIDGGNSFFKDTERREAYFKEKEIFYVGMGVSGGEEGARKGPSMMVGGTPKAYDQIGTYLETIAAKDDFGSVCCTQVGQGGSGHFVKMLHNGIEYAEMQLIAEVYQLLKDHFTKEEISILLSSWQMKEHASFLLETTVKIITHKTEGQYTLDLILDEAGNKGTGSWSTKEALNLGHSATMISAAVQARYDSSNKSDRVSFSSNRSQESLNEFNIDLAVLEQAYHFARLINHHQGFEIIQSASKQYDWNINLSELARIWTNGCILRSSLMKDLVMNFKSVTSVLDHPKYVQECTDRFEAIKQIISIGLNQNVAMPCFYAAYNDWLTRTTANLSANMIQAQRDFFGAHTYKRKDRPYDQSFHTNWEE